MNNYRIIQAMLIAALLMVVAGTPLAEQARLGSKVIAVPTASTGGAQRQQKASLGSTRNKRSKDKKEDATYGEWEGTETTPYRPEGPE